LPGAGIKGRGSRKRLGLSHIFLESAGGHHARGVHSDKASTTPATSSVLDKLKKIEATQKNTQETVLTSDKLNSGLFVSFNG
jgi:hypothetical protein